MSWTATTFTSRPTREALHHGPHSQALAVHSEETPKDTLEAVNARSCGHRDGAGSMGDGPEGGRR